MKNPKIFLSLAAFIFAIGAAFASKSDVLVQGYVPSGATCNTSISCSDSGSNACTTTGGAQVYKYGPTTCDVAMNRI